jgi:8-oxo-dGTP pyrophosphatase MutT (NUDIX family)
MMPSPDANADSSGATKSATPRLAATVLLLRPAGDGELECYMLRRSGGSPFMPDSLVFPGGRLDDADGDPSDDTTWARAAARECAEEAGLTIDVDALRWFDTWCTPSVEPRRFLARFFSVVLEAGDGESAVADGTETMDGRWWTARAALEAWRDGKADLPPPTLCTLLQLEAIGLHGLHRAATELELAILPKASIEGSEIHVVMPHDDAYDQLPGDGTSAPERVRALPTRFTRREGRWTPG